MRPAARARHSCTRRLRRCPSTDAAGPGPVALVAAVDTYPASKKKFGWKQSSVYSVDGDRNNVMVIEEFGSLDRAKAFAASPELKAAMGKAGVAGPPEVRFVTPVAHTKA
jgi:quinol monooxygenase YgiN